MNTRINILLAAIMSTEQVASPVVVGVCSGMADAFTNCTKWLEPECEECFDDENALEGIRELRDWLAVLVRESLRAVKRHGYMRRVIFQPCWSTQRWKSLT